VRLYRGDLWPTLEAALVDEVERLRARDALAPVRIVVPTALARAHVRVLVAERLGGGHLDLSVETLGAIAHRHGSPVLAAKGLAVAPRAALALAAADAARTLTRARFAPVATARGFGGAAAATLTDLSDAGLAPQDLRAVALASDAPDDLLDLADLWTEVRHAFDRAGFVEEAWLYEAAAGAVPARPTVLYGLYDATHAQRVLLEALVRGVAAAAMVPIGPAFADPFLAWLESKGATPVEPPPGEPVPASLAAAREALFTEGGPAVGAIEIRSCPSPISEAREAVRTLVAEVRAGARPDTLAVLTRSDDLAVPPLGEILEDARFPADVRLRRGAMPPPDAALLHALLEARRSRTGRHAWMDVLAAPGIRLDALAPEADRQARSPSSWDAVLRGLGLAGEVATMRRRLDATAAAVESDPGTDEVIRARRAAPIRALSAAWGALATLLEAIPDRGFPGESARALGDVAHRLLGRPLDPVTRAALDEIGALDALDRPVDLADFAALVSDAIAAVAPPPVAGGAVVADLLSARGATFRTAVVTGLVEKTFPRVSHGDPLLPDELRALLAARTRRPLASKRASSESEERFLLRLALGSVRERLVVTFHRRDGSGKERAPSVFVYALADAAAGRPIATDEIHRQACVTRVPAGRSFPADPALALGTRERTLSRVHFALRARDASALRAALAGIGFARQALEAEEARWRSTAQGPWDGKVSGTRVLATGALERALSASRVERFVRCPFRFLLIDAIGVRPEESREATVGLDRLQRGNAVHSALRRLVEARLGARVPEDRATLLDRARAALTEEVTRLAAAGALTHRTTAEAEALALAPRVSDTLESLFAENLRPIAVEEAFEDLEIAVGDTTLRLRGRIDRVDARGGEGRVVDYKTGSADASSRRIPKLVQLPIYARAAAKLHPEVDRWGAKLDRVARDGKKPKDEVDPQTLARDFGRVMGALVEAASAGELPQNAAQCQLCPVRAACEPVAAIRRLARRKALASGHRRLASLLESEEP
jgi:putative RecB family exonuclease